MFMFCDCDCDCDWDKMGSEVSIYRVIFDRLFIASKQERKKGKEEKKSIVVLSR